MIQRYVGTLWREEDKWTLIGEESKDRLLGTNLSELPLIRNFQKGDLVEIIIVSHNFRSTKKIPKMKLYKEYNRLFKINSNYIDKRDLKEIVKKQLTLIELLK